MKLPIIDVNALTPAEITTRVRLACETNGFFILRNHPVKQSTIHEMHVASKLFYALPVKFKMRAKQNANNRGYSPIMEEKLDVNANGDSKEGFYIGRECEDWEMDLPLRGKNVWWPPEEEEEAKEEGEEGEEARKIGIRFRLAMERYYEEMVQFCDGFVPTFAEALGLPGFFEDKFKPHNALLRPLKYGKVKSEGKQFACGAHSDYGVLTMLWVQPGSEGLEIFDEKSESWMQVNLGGAEDEGKESERPDDFICNIGDLMQFWTNDRFKSIES